MDKALDRTEIESPFIIFEGGVVVELAGDKPVGFRVGRDLTRSGLQADQPVGCADPQVFVFVGQDAEGNVARHAVFYGVMQGLAGLEVIFDNPFYGSEPHIAVFVLASVVDKIVTLGVQLVVRQIHAGIADRIVIETAVEHAGPDSSQAVLVDAVHRERGKLRSI